VRAPNMPAAGSRLRNRSQPLRRDCRLRRQLHGRSVLWWWGTEQVRHPIVPPIDLFWLRREMWVGERRVLQRDRLRRMPARSDVFGVLPMCGRLRRSGRERRHPSRCQRRCAIRRQCYRCRWIRRMGRIDSRGWRQLRPGRVAERRWREFGRGRNWTRRLRFLPYCARSHPNTRCVHLRVDGADSGRVLGVWRQRTRV
jgi:hypothetical protein